LTQYPQPAKPGGGRRRFRRRRAIDGARGKIPELKACQKSAQGDCALERETGVARICRFRRRDHPLFISFAALSALERFIDRQDGAFPAEISFHGVFSLYNSGAVPSR
jgi:hypothetical protein